MVDALSLDQALKQMVASLASAAPRHFHVGIVGYFLDGIPYSATGLAVSSDQTPSLVATHDGFACEGFFPVDILEPAESPRGVFTTPTGIEVAQVQIEVKTRDIWAIAEFVEGVQHDLFLDADVLIARKEAFAEERAIWMEASGRSH